ncbi:hypothetical protein BJV74DRAFT_796150 [Russula compacta]|nr:hypothetical protein BJV74DRAFT_796150 [Russula compacta]
MDSFQSYDTQSHPAIPRYYAVSSQTEAHECQNSQRIEILAGQVHTIDGRTAPIKVERIIPPMRAIESSSRFFSAPSFHEISVLRPSSKRIRSFAPNSIWEGLSKYISYRAVHATLSTLTVLQTITRASAIPHSIPRFATHTPFANQAAIEPKSLPSLEVTVAEALLSLAPGTYSGRPRVPSSHDSRQGGSSPAYIGDPESHDIPSVIAILRPEWRDGGA